MSATLIVAASRTSIVGLLTGIVLASILASYLQTGQRSAQAPAVSISETSHLAVPLAFEPNVGQVDPAVSFVAHSSAGTEFFTPSQIVFALDPRPSRSAGPGRPTSTETSPAPGLLRVEFLNSSASARLESAASTGSKVNYMLGPDPGKWHLGIPTSEEIVYRELYPGIDLQISGSSSSLKGTYVVSPGTDAAVIRWRYLGARNAEVDSSGNLRIEVSATSLAVPLTVSEMAPDVWQEASGRRIKIRAAYSISTDGSIGFTLGSYDPRASLIIDPLLAYSTYLGGTGSEEMDSVAVDASGSTYVTGRTFSTNFPVANPFQSALRGTSDAYISKLSADGLHLVYSTYLGGSGSEWGYAVAVDPSGNPVVVGETDSSDFPLANALQSSYGGGSDAFVTKLSSQGTGLLYSTYLGGSSTDVGESVSFDASFNLYVFGWTDSTNFPVLNPYQATNHGSSDLFVSKISSGGNSLIYSTYIGGTSLEFAYSVVVDATGNAYLTGSTYSADYPTINALQGALSGYTDAFISKLNPVGNGLIFSSYLGGSGDDYARGVTVDAGGNVYLAGQTTSSNFPVLSAYQPTNHGGWDCFAVRINSPGTSLNYATYLGGSGYDACSSIGLDSAGNIYLAGGTGSSNFPVANAVQSYYAGGAYDAFVAALNPQGTQLVYSTYLGGSGDDYAFGIALSASGVAYSVGRTSSVNFPTSNALQPNNAGGDDGFIAKLANMPTPTATPPNPPTRTPVRTPTTVPTPTLGVCAMNFSDVSPADQFYTAVRYLYCHGVISGYADGTFRPYNNTTRSQLCKIVVLGYGLPFYSPPSPSFIDVPTTNPFYEYVETAYHSNLISGYADSTFRPGAYITRAQLVKIVVNASGWPLLNPGTPTFQDVERAHAFYQYVETAYAHGIISGYTCGSGCLEFRPSNYAYRSQIAKIVYLALLGTGFHK